MKKLIILYTVCCIINGCNRHKPYDNTAEELLYEKIATLGSEGKFHETITAADSALKLNLSDSTRAYIMLERMVAMGNSGNTRQAKLYADSVRRFGEKHGIKEVAMNAIATQGGCYRREGQNDSALIRYKEALKIANDNDDKEYEQYLNDMLAIIYAEMSRTGEGMEFSRHAVEIAHDMQDTTAMISAISTTGQLYLQNRQYREALNKLLPYMPMLGSIGPAAYHIKFLTPVIKAYLELDKNDSAEYYINIAENLTRNMPANHQSVVAILTAKAQLAGKRQQYKEQLALFNRIDTLGTHGKAKDKLLLERAQCYYNLGNGHKAYQLMGEAYLALDSMRHSELENAMSEYAVKYETQLKEISIERLRNERIVLAATIAALVILIMAIIIYIMYKREKFKQKSILERHENYIRGLENERERIAKELHDGICNDMLAMTFTLADDKQTVSQINTLAAKVRQLSHDLMPPQFKDCNLSQILMSYVMTMNRNAAGPHITITDEGCYDWAHLPADHSFELYRIVQESVGNAQKHAKASHIAITLDGDGEHYRLTIENDGVSDSRNNTGGGIGSTTLQMRAANIGAHIETNTDKDKYTVTISH